MERTFHELFSEPNSGHSSRRSEGRDGIMKEELKPSPEVQKSISERLIEDYEKKEYFKMLGLPEPDVDELGKPTWQCTPEEVSRSYRKLTVQVHPDKNRDDPKAREAFEALSKAYKLLKDPASLDELLRSSATKLAVARARREAALDVTDRVQLYAKQNEKARNLRKEEAASFEREIKEQVRRRQEDARRRAEVQKRAREKEMQRGNGCEGGEGVGRKGDAEAEGRDGKLPKRTDDREEDGSSEEEGWASKARQKNSKRRKPVFM